MAWVNRSFGLAIAATLFLVDQLVKGWLLGPLQLREREVIGLLPFFDLPVVQTLLGFETAVYQQVGAAVPA